MPSWWITFVWSQCLFFCVCSMVVMLLYFRGLRGSQRRVMQATGAFVFFLALTCVCFLIQGFASVAVHFFQGFSMLSVGIMLGYYSGSILNVTLKSLNMTENKRLALRLRFFRVAFWMNAILLPLPWVCVWPVFVYLGDPEAADYDVELYNRAAVFPMPVMWIHNLLFFPTFVVMTVTLVRFIDESLKESNKKSETIKSMSTSVVQREKMLDVRRRLWLFLFVSAGVLAPIEVLTQWIPVALYLTKAPGMWLFMYFSVGTEGILALLMLVALKARKRKAVPNSTELHTTGTSSRRVAGGAGDTVVVSAALP